VSPDHIRVLKAFAQEPDPNPGMTGSPIQTLRVRLPELDERRIEDIVAQLNDMRITNLGNLKTLMTGHGAADLRNVVTEFGSRIVKYIYET